MPPAMLDDPRKHKEQYVKDLRSTLQTLLQTIEKVDSWSEEVCAENLRLKRSLDAYTPAPTKAL